MSSMLKKSGGLSFKPKLKPNPRKGAPASGTAPAKPAPTASNNSTNTPATEPSSQSSTPGPVPADTSSTPSSATAGEISKDPPSFPNAQPSSAVISTPAESSIVQPAPDAAPLPTPPATAPSQNTQSNPPASQQGHDQDQSQATSGRTKAPIAPSRRSIANAPVPAEPVRPHTTSQTQPNNVDNFPVPDPPIRPAEAPPSPQTTVPDQPGASSGDHDPSAAGPSGITSESIAAGTATNGESSKAAAAPRKKRAYKKRQPPALENDGDAQVSETPAPKKKRAHRKRPQPTETPTEQSDGPATTEGESATTSQPVKRRKRSVTPEDAEERTVDHSIMKVGDLTKDLRIGKRFKHADAIAQRAKEARARQRQKKIEKQQRRLGLLPDDDEDNAAESQDNRRGNRAVGSAGPNSTDMDGDFGAGEGVGYEVVDGQIVVNQQSLVVDRHAANQDMSSLVTVEEDEFTHLTTAHSYLRESRNIGSNSWTDDETEKFYRYLQMFGTDFETISHMFPGKRRRHVKLKFNREERLRPRRVNAAIMVRGQKTVEIDIDEYKGHRKNWETTDKIEEEQNLLRLEHKKEVRRLRAERRAQGLADEGDDDDSENEDNNDGKAKKPEGDGNESSKDLDDPDDETDAAEKNTESQPAQAEEEVEEEVIENLADDNTMTLVSEVAAAAAEG